MLYNRGEIVLKGQIKIFFDFSLTQKKHSLKYYVTEF